MKTYKLHVSMPSSKFGVDVVADYVETDDNRLDFYIEDELVASYPNQYTIIESIKDER
jgi:hypothetical protein